ncbi:6-phospho-3-hexuloisomerase [Paucisalibacillus sp. EB02]|uniref:6-phospho-3-hexuloisomerase n=1 Tax=Paucisalibacillus sp. EB02 TaxID=1347087 RepID=UPI0004B20F4C|nr:6-phospho-3-hexuloisomerase [Paucisalibacillus sp. EB02]
MKTIIKTVSSEITEVLNRVNEEEVVQLHDVMTSSNRIFIAGTGRSGLIGKVFGMRLMHNGFNVFIVGETTTPSIQNGDILLLISGSGNTASLVNFAKKAKEVGAKLALVTTNRKSTIAEMSDCVITIPAATKKRKPEEPKTIQPLGSQFDQSAHLLLDALIVYNLVNNEGKDHEQLKSRHANLE